MSLCLKYSTLDRLRMAPFWMGKFTAWTSRRHGMFITSVYSLQSSLSLCLKLLEVCSKRRAIRRPGESNGRLCLY